MKTLIAPPEFEVVSFGGEAYPVQDGKVAVPDEAAPYLYQYGFANEAKPAKPKPAKSAEAATS